MYGPRYITAQNVVDLTSNKVAYDLVPTLPQPNVVTPNLDGSTTLSWTIMPAGFLLLSSHQTGALVTQGQAYGQYGGTTTGLGYSILILPNGNTTAPFTINGGGLTIIPEPNSMSLDLLNTLIARAEASVEIDLNPLFITPFIGINGEAFNQLPSQTYNYLTDMFVTRACYKVMTSEFAKIREGSGALDFIKVYDIQYKNMRDRLLVRAKTGNLLTYPLEGLALNTSNLRTPYVTIPRVYTDNVQAVTYAKNRINNPAITTLGVGFPFGIKYTGG